MTRIRTAAFTLAAAAALALVGASTALGVQESHGTAPPQERAAQQLAEGAPPQGGKPGLDIAHHIRDSHELELPYWKSPYYYPVHLPRWEPLHLGPVTLDLSPTKHVVMLLVAALLCLATLLTAAAAHKRHSHQTGVPKGFAAGIESMVLYLRNEVILPNVGHHGEKYVPFCLTLFFFILFANLLGLIPYGATATGNIAVTGMLAIITFVVVEVSGMRALGKDYLGTVVYWPKDNPVIMNVLMTPIMTPVEIMGKFTKPFALAIRLFANMTAGHVVVLALISLIFTFGSYAIAGAPVLLAVAVMMLEIFVAFLQAFVFTLLSSVFIGQIREAHH